MGSNLLTEGRHTCYNFEHEWVKGHLVKGCNQLYIMRTFHSIKFAPTKIFIQKKTFPGQGSGYAFSKGDLAFGSLNYSKFGYWTLIKLLFFVLM